MNILVHSTSIALWHEIIHEAEANCAITLTEKLEAYLVFLMMRYLTKTHLAKQIVAQDYLTGMKLPSSQRELMLQGVGDKCLLFSGLFPKRADKRLVKISYFVNLGQSAYGTLAKSQQDLYALLAKQFVSLMDVLQSLRQHTPGFTELLPLQAYDLWNETGSKRALTALKQYTHATPIYTYFNEDHSASFKLIK